ncbi:hypothetical protein FACS1894218_0300 [Bacilli bacterium]|nr:hypothetical protein FACS1894218_0300 [Bacilli bacterium]
MLKEDEIKHGLYVYGNVGIGKTYTMVALGNELALKGKKIAFIASQDLSYEIKNG